MNIKIILGCISILLFAGHSYAYNCNGVTQYVAGNAYGNGAVVQNAGYAFSCKVAGWCGIGGPYAPPSGWAYKDAWNDLGSCGTTTTSSSGTASSAARSSVASSTSTGGNCPNWAAGTFYAVGVVVKYNNAFYRAKNENPGYDPVVSTWFWEPVASCPGGTTSSVSVSSTGGGSCPQWVAGAMYYAGNKVAFSGNYFIAEHDNPGYDPLVSTWFWEPIPSSQCGGGSNSSSNSSVTNPGTGFAAIVSQAQFNQMFPNRNPFYTYSGLVAAAQTYPAFAGTGSLDVKKREAAAAMANFHHETGGLVHITEIARGLYCGDWDNNPSTCPCAPGKSYYGRGPIQLSWNGNYCAAGQALGLNLLNNPDLVEQNATVAWQTALWFWMTQSGSGFRPAHQNMVENYGFGETIRTINGSIECNGGNPAQVQSRINLYNQFIQILGGTACNNLGC
jgi:predicted chitinase